MNNMPHDIIETIESYARAAGVLPSTVTNNAVSSGLLYARLKAGKTCTLKTVEKIKTYIKENPISNNKK